MEYLIWLYLVLENIAHLSVLLAIIATSVIGVTGLILGLMYINDELEDKTWDSCKTIASKCKWWYVVVVSLALLIPTREDLYFILGGTVLYEAAQSVEEGEFQKLPDNSVKALNRFLEQLSAEEDNSNE